MVVSLTFMNGLMFGVGHIGGDEEDAYHYVVIVSFAFMQLSFTKYKLDSE